MKKSRLRLQDVPEEFRERLINNLKLFRFFETPEEAITSNVLLAEAFPWMLTEEGHKFWDSVDNGARVTTDDLLDAVSEAQSRGFKAGVFTKYGQIFERSPIDGKVYRHELLPCGTLYYNNVKVRNAKGKWIKPITEEKFLQSAKSKFLETHKLREPKSLQNTDEEEFIKTLQAIAKQIGLNLN
jgi:hypothetical protein